MFSLVWRALSGVRTRIHELRKLGVRVFFALTAVQPALMGILAAIAKIRERRHGSSGGFRGWPNLRSNSSQTTPGSCSTLTASSSTKKC